LAERLARFWLVEKAKARWADAHPIEEDGTPEHVDYIITYMAKVTTLPDDQLDKSCNTSPVASIGPQAPRNASTRSGPSKPPKAQARTNMSVRGKPCG
jgi:hypothetical protein